MTQASEAESILSIDREQANGRSRLGFVQLFAVAVLVIHSAFTMSIMFMVPELARSPVIWGLWLSVAVIATGGFIAGRQLHVASQQA